MSSWTILPTEEDDCIGIVVHDKDLKPLVILHTVKDKDNKAYICKSDNGLCLITRRGDTPSWDISPLPKELI